MRACQGNSACARVPACIRVLSAHRPYKAQAGREGEVTGTSGSVEDGTCLGSCLRRGRWERKMPKSSEETGTAVRFNTSFRHPCPICTSFTFCQLIKVISPASHQEDGSGVRCNFDPSHFWSSRTQARVLCTTDRKSLRLSKHYSHSRMVSNQHCCKSKSKTFKNVALF